MPILDNNNSVGVFAPRNSITASIVKIDVYIIIYIFKYYKYILNISLELFFHRDHFIGFGGIIKQLWTDLHF